MNTPITIVSGFGRCGSTLVMAMLAAGGMPTVGGPPDYEDDRVTRLPAESEWMSAYAGHALKVLDPHWYQPPPGEYRWIWLTRDPREQAKSFIKFATAAGVPLRSGRAERKRVEASYRTDTPKALAVIRRRGGPLLPLRFEHIVGSARATAELLSAHCGGLNVDAMAAVVRPRQVGCLPYLSEAAV